MAQLTEIYQKYKIMPALQAHQLRVAAVAKQICDNLTTPIDTESVVAACLLHDMANIIKFDLSQFPEFAQPEGLEYWQKIKDEYLQKYKTQDEHPATLAIARELGVSERVQELINAVGFIHGEDNANSPDYGRKICAYADMRVGPHGVLSLEERLMESARRYTKQILKLGERKDDFALALRKIEEQIFSRCKVEPGDINDRSVAAIIKELKNYEV